MRETEEHRRLRAARTGVPWKKWGPYLSERQWGTVREDYSESGDAWNYFSHDQARSRAYRWGEDGLAGLSDDKQRFCFGLALWNERDPILKERLFGLTNSEGNHGEDVKEYYFYVDSTPTHSYMKFVYKYPQNAYPYAALVAGNRARGREQPELELIDTGIFAEDRYFDVVVEYAKAGPEDLLIRITAHNRGPAAAPLHVLPTFWFRNTWAWGDPGAVRPQILAPLPGVAALQATHPELGRLAVHFAGDVPLLFTENETNRKRLFGAANAFPHVKDAFHEHLVGKRRTAVSPVHEGTKAAAHYSRRVPPGEAWVMRLRLSPSQPGPATLPDVNSEPFDRIVAARAAEANAFYDSISPPSLGEDQRRVMRQALAGMLWTKQYYYFDLDRWVSERGGGTSSRNRHWRHMVNDDIISMPDKWEYPWYAAWDLAFHTVALNMVDRDFAREQIELMLSERYLHPNGQMPAYEWNFGDVNPPVHAWAALFSYLSHDRPGDEDRQFLKRSFQKLLLNFTWWVNRKDPGGNNLFEGGFLGLDNIGVFDRSSALPSGGRLEQADGTAWMAFFCQNMLQIAIELGRDDPTYEPMVTKFVEHFLWIASSMDCVGDTCDEMWDEEDGFYYDVLRMPDGSAQRLKVRSMVGLLPLAATTVLSREDAAHFPNVQLRLQSFLAKRPQLLANMAPMDKPGVNGAYLLSAINEAKLRRILARMLDESRFLSPYGIRSMSRTHLEEPYHLVVNGQRYDVQYLPGESNSGMFGGNSNWRGPVWLPVNLLIVRALLQFYLYHGDDFRVECPTGSGRMCTLFEVAREISARLSAIFLRNEQGQRPVYGCTEKFQNDPHFRDLISFYEYFHGDNGAGLGASHQTGWTGTVAKLIQLFSFLTPEDVLSAAHSHPTVPNYNEF